MQWFCTCPNSKNQNPSWIIKCSPRILSSFPEKVIYNCILHSRRFFRLSFSLTPWILKNKTDMLGTASSAFLQSLTSSVFWLWCDKHDDDDETNFQKSSVALPVGYLLFFTTFSFPNPFFLHFCKTFKNLCVFRILFSLQMYRVK